MNYILYIYYLFMTLYNWVSKCILWVILLALPLSAFAEKGDVLFIKWEVHTKTSRWHSVTLKDSYKVLEVWRYEDNIDIVLTDGRTTTIRKDSIYSATPQWIINGNAWYALFETKLYSRPNKLSRVLGEVASNDAFVLKRLEIISENWVKVSFISGDNQGKTGYILISDVIFSCVDIDKYNIFKWYFRLPDGIFRFFNNSCELGEEVRVYWNPDRLEADTTATSNETKPSNEDNQNTKSEIVPASTKEDSAERDIIKILQDALY